ncbi:MAG: hypothetical protein U5N55_11640 [Cypionkella sp.]|nr:hypothetical protein [Cypionkella sp.]
MQAPLEFTEAINPASKPNVIPSYTTAMNARVFWADNGQRFELIDADIEYIPGQTWNFGAVRTSGYIRPIFERPRVRRGYGGGLLLRGTWHAVVQDPRFDNLSDNTGAGQFGYGVADGGTGTIVRGMVSSNTRHAYTSSNLPVAVNANAVATIAVGRVPGALLDGCTDYGGSEAPSDTHQQSVRATFVNCTAAGGRNAAINFRGQDIKAINPRARSMEHGINVFTEFENGDGAPFNNGKRRSDYTSAVIDAFDIECQSQPLRVTHAVAVCSGRTIARVFAGHEAVYNNGGSLTLTGTHTFVMAGSGPANTGVIYVGDVNAAATDAFSSARTTVFGIVTIDARNCTTSGLRAVEVQTGAELVIADGGVLRLFLPSGAVWRGTDTGNIRCEGTGRIEYSVEGAADNSMFPVSDGLVGLRIAAMDGTLFWDDAISPRNALLPIQSNYTVGVSHTGTGAEVQGVYTAPGQRASKAMNDRGAGTVRVSMSGLKSGTASAATLILRSGGANLVANDIVLPSTAARWELVADTVWTGVSDQDVYITAQAWNASGALVYRYEAVKAEVFTFPTHSSAAIILGINAPVGVTVTVARSEVQATSGGLI